MSTSVKRDEPSMEEILASIRKIISDQDAPAPTAANAPAPQVVSDSAAPLPKAPEAVLAEPIVEAVTPSPVEHEDEIVEESALPPLPDSVDEAILNLTKVVEEDGSITDLTESTAVDDMESFAMSEAAAPNDSFAAAVAERLAAGDQFEEPGYIEAEITSVVENVVDEDIAAAVTEVADAMAADPVFDPQSGHIIFEDSIASDAFIEHDANDDDNAPVAAAPDLADDTYLPETSTTDEFPMTDESANLVSPTA
jgi:hypothetical protein